MKTKIFTILWCAVAFFSSTLNAQNLNLAWAKGMGGTGFSSADGVDVKTDIAGNVYTIGNFFGTVDFDPSAGVANLTSAGGLDMFISKLDVSGNLVWAKRMGGVNDAKGYSIAIDNAGNIYTTGYFGGIVDFDPNAGVVNLASSNANYSSAFISKLDANGNFVWAKVIGGSDETQAYSIALDATNNVYITGTFTGIVDFDPNVGVVNLPNANDYDTFISKLDVNGNFIWARAMQGADRCFGLSIAVDATNNVYTTGTFEGTVDFNPNAGIVNLTSAGEEDIFISKLDVSGNFVWAKRIGGFDVDIATSKYEGFIIYTFRIS